MGITVHLVDGTFELFRAFYSSPPRTTAQGEEVGATRGLLRSLAALVDGGATHLAVAFDHEVTSFRNEMFAGYKTGEGIEPALLAQFPLVEEAAAALGMVVWPMVEVEADDALGTAAVRFAAMPEVDQVVICSPDKDMGQVVSGTRIVMLDRIRKRVLDEAAIVEKFGVSPASIPDWLGLVGDKADGIPGIARWGAKSTATVLAHYGHIEAIPADPSTWAVKVRGAKTLSANLEAARTEALLYRKLATLRLDVPLTESLQELRWRGPYRDRLHKLCMRVEDERFWRRFE